MLNHYIVLCLNNNNKLVRATSESFPKYADALEYAQTVYPGRRAVITKVVCIVHKM